MLKKIVFILFIAAVLGLSALYVKEESVQFTPPDSTSQTPSPTPNPNLKTIDFSGKVYKAALFSSSSEKIKLIPNFIEKKEAKSITNICINASSAGFYTKGDRPTGLFVSDGKVLRKNNTSNLFNGFFLIFNDNQVSISRSSNLNNLKHGIQTGPLLVKDKIVQKLSLSKDEEARRNVLIITEDNSVIFASIFKEKAKFSGPYLIELPQIIERLSKDENLKIIDAINLDGGSASFFKTKDIILEELTHSGALFCITE